MNFFEYNFSDTFLMATGLFITFVFFKSSKMRVVIKYSELNGDINVTSPTGLKTYYDLSKINLAKTFWKGLKA